jgi:predicted Zn-dependent peptidase
MRAAGAALPVLVLAPGLSLLLGTAAAPARGLVDDPALRARTTKLGNGLTVLTLEDRSTPVVSFQMWVRVGSGDEARYTGLAHLFEHMMFRGTKHLEPEAYSRILEARGGRVNAYTSRDVTVYHADVTAEHLPLVIELEAERLRHLDISEPSLASEREVVLEERRLRTEDSPQGLVFEALLALAFQAHPYRVPTIGWRSDVESVGVQECLDFFRTYYAPDNIVISIAGDFDAGETLALIGRHFGSIEPAGRIPRNPTVEPEQRGERRETVLYDVRGPVVAAAWHAPAAGHADAEPLDVASEILSSGRTSRLYRRLVYEAQQALSASGGYWELQRAGLFFAFAAVRPGADVARSEALLLGEIERLRQEAPSAAEVEKAKRGLEVSLVDGLATNHALASRIASDTVTLGRIRSLEERLAAIRAVTPEDVRRVARLYLPPETRSVVRLVAPGDAAAGPSGAPGSGR